MEVQRPRHAAVHWYVEELGARVVARSGRPEDRHHLGKLLLQGMRDALPSDVSQIDGATGESESTGSVLSRSVRCARALAAAGLRPGDFIALMAPNHLHLAIPLYAALFSGIAIAPLDYTSTVCELQACLGITTPKMVFCQSKRTGDVKKCLDLLKLEATIVTFDEEEDDGFYTFQHFLNKYGGEEPEETFKCADLDPAEALAVLLSTSGTTGCPKYVAATHLNFAITSTICWVQYSQFPRPTRMQLTLSPLHWVTAVITFILSPIYRYPRLQTSNPITLDHLQHLFKTYKPSFSVMSTTLLSRILTGIPQADFASFESLFVGGSPVPHALIQDMQNMHPHINILNSYGISELMGAVFMPDLGVLPAGSCGRPLHCFQYRLVDTETGKDITDYNVTGELWVKGPGVFKGYFRNPSASEEAFAAGGWFRTGDLFYRDRHWNFYFVERIKLLLKYMSKQGIVYNVSISIICIN